MGVIDLLFFRNCRIPEEEVFLKITLLSIPNSLLRKKF